MSSRSSVCDTLRSGFTASGGGDGGAGNDEFVAFDREPARISIGMVNQVRVVYGDGASSDLLRADPYDPAAYSTIHHFYAEHTDRETLTFGFNDTIGGSCHTPMSEFVYFGIRCIHFVPLPDGRVLEYGTPSGAEMLYAELLTQLIRRFISAPTIGQCFQLAMEIVWVLKALMFTDDRKQVMEGSIH